jgi:hypothetical protein
MRREIFAALFLSFVGCSNSDVGIGESLGETGEALNGALSARGFLVKTSTVSSPDEATRQLDTKNYYLSPRTGTASNGSGSTIWSALPTLTAFRNLYFGWGSEVRARYYNRGDLGLGRDMHCVDRSAFDGQIACYVTNFAAGPDGTEFTFGLSENIAFQNMNQGHLVATVAMVYREYATWGDKILFMVYDQNGNLTNAAPLDRHGLNFATEFKNNPNPNPTVFGTPGKEFNNHIPSNCLNCHGGKYVPNTHSVTGAVFLPFDLDQFQYQDVAGQRLADQLTAFRSLNQMARKVAFRSAGYTATAVTTQIDGWYGNVNSEILSGNFNAGYVPAGWASAPDFYYSVVRRSCRGCHMTLPKLDANNQLNALRFESSNDFNAYAAASAGALRNHFMPHALQSQREFWLSSQPAKLANYLNSVDSAAATLFQSASPLDVVTLDPPAIMAAIQ